VTMLTVAPQAVATHNVVQGPNYLPLTASRNNVARRRDTDTGYAYAAAAVAVLVRISSRQPRASLCTCLSLHALSSTALTEHDPELAVRVDGLVVGRFGPRQLTYKERGVALCLSVIGMLSIRCYATSPRSFLGQALIGLTVLSLVFLTTRFLLCAPRLHRAHDVLPMHESCIEKLCGLNVHYLRRKQSNPQRAVVCFHGFGASGLSWVRGWESLGNMLASQVLAFDAPGFGLTERPPLPLTESSLSASPYSCMSSAKIGLALSKLHKPKTVDADSCNLVILGHSMGAIGASLMALELPAEEKSSTVLVLESPAFSAVANEGPKPPQLSPPAWRLRPVVALLPWILRRLVYRRRFWEKGLQAAGVVGKEAVMQYRWPSLVKSWDHGLTRFVATRLHGKPEETDLSNRLCNACREHNLKILIVHGAADRVIPASNSRTLAEAVGATLSVMPECGHVAHEELPVEFAKAVGAFIASAFPPPPPEAMDPADKTSPT